MKTLLLKLKKLNPYPNDLVKAIEEEFGVTAAAPVVAKRSWKAGTLKAAKDSFDVELTAAGDKSWRYQRLYVLVLTKEARTC